MSRAFKVNLGIKDLQQQLGNIKQYDAQTQAKMRGAVQESTSNIYAGAKRRVRVRSGGLQRTSPWSITTRPIPEKFGPSLRMRI